MEAISKERKKRSALAVRETATGYLFFMLYISSAVAVSYVWAALLNPTSEPVNMFLKAIGIAAPLMWLTSTKWTMVTVIIISV